MESFSGQPVRNITGDTTSPKFVSAGVKATTLNILFDEPLDEASAPAPGRFAYAAGGVSMNATAVSISGRVVTLTLPTAVTDGQTVTVSYRKASGNPLQDLAGNDVTDTEVSSRPVTNDPTAPALDTATVTGATLTITINRVLDPNATPAPKNFQVKVNDYELSQDVRVVEVNRVAIENDMVTLTLASEVSATDDNVTVFYAMPQEEASRIRDLAGITMPSFRINTINTRLVTGITAVEFTNQPSGRYAIPGNHIEVTLTFNQGVTVSGKPRMELSPAFGPDGETRHAVYHGRPTGSLASRQLVFRYTLVEGDDSSGVNVSVAANALDVDGAVGSASIRATGTETDVSPSHAAADSGKLVSAVTPKITQSWSWLAPTIDADLDGEDETYVMGNSFNVSLKFSDLLQVASTGTNGENARIVVKIGSTNRTLNFKSISTDLLNFGTYTIAASDTDDDGITIVRDSSGNLVRLSGGATIQKKDAGTSADLTAEADLPIWVVTGSIQAEVRGSNAVPTGTDFTKVTATNVDLTFSKDDFAITDGDEDPLKEIRVATLPNSAHGTLELDGTAITSGDLPQTVTHTELDEDKLVFAPVNDYEGDASFTFKVVDSLEAEAASANTATVKVVPLSVTGVEIISAPSRDADNDGAAETYRLGNKVLIRLTFTEAVDVDTTGGKPRLMIKMDPGYGEKWATYDSGSGTANLVFAHTVVWPNESPQGIAVLANTLDLNGGTIRSSLNQADAALVHGGLGHDPAHKVDTDICGRTPQVRDALVEATGKACDRVGQAEIGALRYLHLEEKGITSLKLGDFDGLYNLRGLYLSINDLTTLPRGLFRDLWNVRTLDLWHNPLATLPANAFGNRPSLEDLDLRQTQLTWIHPDAFEGLPNLEYLDLAQNSLTTLPAGLFAHTPRLRHVTVAHNDITSLPEGIFDGLTNLWGLAVCFTDLGSLPNGVFDDLTSLERLQLQGNGLDSLRAGVFRNLANLEDLYLQLNDFRTLPENTFSGLTKLEDLRLDNNSLETLPDNLFRGLEAPLKIVLSYNWGSPFDLDKLGVEDGVEVEQ